MYYDRKIDEPLALTIAPAAPLSWLMDHVRSGEGAARLAHVQFRRSRGARRRGGIQLYWGRTSPLEFRLGRHDRVSLHADATYRNLSEQLFSEPVGIDRLHARRDDLRAHLARASKLLDDSPPRRRAFVTGEAVYHAGMMRRYGHDWRTGDPFVLIDSEARIGYDSRGQRDADEAETRTQLRLRDAVQMPTKLDALGILPSGDLALVEVKDADGDIDRALEQAAAHAVRYARLMDHGRLREALQGMVDQEAATRVLPPACPRPGPVPRIVPCIAAPDDSVDCPASWWNAFDACGSELRAALSDLVFIRIDRGGRVLELSRR